MRGVWLIGGLAGLGMAALGVALPLLPATPFAILAAWCFARSSPALRGWLLRNRALGGALRDWHAQRAISRKGKTAGVLTMALSLGVSVALGIELALVGLQALALSGAAAFVLTRPTAA